MDACIVYKDAIQKENFLQAGQITALEAEKKLQEEKAKEWGFSKTEWALIGAGAGLVGGIFLMRSVK